MVRVIAALLALVLGGGMAWWLLSAPGPSDAPTKDTQPLEALENDAGKTSEEKARARELRASRASEFGGAQNAAIPGRALERVDLKVRVLPPAGHELAMPVDVEIRSLGVDPREASAAADVRWVEATAVGGDSPAFEADFEEVRPHGYRVLAKAPGLDTVFTLIRLDARAPLTRIDLVLLPLCSLEGILYKGEDPRMRVASAPLALDRVEPDMEGNQPRFETFADGEGAYRFDDIPPATYRLHIGPQGRDLITPLRVVVEKPGSKQDVGGLPEVGEVAFSTFDELGKPLPGVSIAIAPEHPEDLGGGLGETDEQGVFRLGALPPGTYLVVARLEGFRMLKTRYKHQATGFETQLQPLVLRTP